MPRVFQAESCLTFTLIKITALHCLYFNKHYPRQSLPLHPDGKREENTKDTKSSECLHKKTNATSLPTRTDPAIAFFALTAAWAEGGGTLDLGYLHLLRGERQSGLAESPRVPAYTRVYTLF